MRVHLSLKSGNTKTGPIPVSSTEENSCPDSCPFKKKGCYGKSHFLAKHWKLVSSGERAIEWSHFISLVSSFPAGQLWRHNQIGDLPGKNETIDPVLLGELVAANLGKRGFTYTHKHTSRENLHWIRACNANGFTVNLSANSLAHADTLSETQAGPVVTVLPAIHGSTKTRTPKGREVIVCPATYRENVSCATCKLCAIRDRSFIVGFPAHGSSKNEVSRVFFMKKEG